MNLTAQQKHRLIARVEAELSDTMDMLAAHTEEEDPIGYMQYLAKKRQLQDELDMLRGNAYD